MPHRYKTLEKFAFSLVVLSALACSAYIAYETNPDVKVVLQAGKSALRYAGEFSYICALPDANACAQLPMN